MFWPFWGNSLQKRRALQNERVKSWIKCEWHMSTIGGQRRCASHRVGMLQPEAGSHCNWMGQCLWLASDWLSEVEKIEAKTGDVCHVCGGNYSQAQVNTEGQSEGWGLPLHVCLSVLIWNVNQMLHTLVSGSEPGSPRQFSFAQNASVFFFFFFCLKLIKLPQRNSSRIYTVEVSPAGGSSGGIGLVCSWTENQPG